MKGEGKGFMFVVGANSLEREIRERRNNLYLYIRTKDCLNFKQRGRVIDFEFLAFFSSFNSLIHHVTVRGAGG